MLRIGLFATFLSIPIHANSKATSSAVPVIDTTMPAAIPAEIIADWKMKDSISTNYSVAIAAIKQSLPARYASKIDTGSTEELYLKACHWRRVSRIQPLSHQIKKLLCARHYNEGGALTGFLEDLNNDTAVRGDGRKYFTPSKGSQYKPGAALLVLNFDDYYPAPLTLLEDKTGVIRDPCVSFDAKRIAFAWSKDNNGYHIYEMEIARPDNSRQLTFDLQDYDVSDYEPCYLPNSDIIFNSSRCFQGHEMSTNLVSNFFIMNKDGKYLRRLCYDQAHDFHPTVTSDGKVMFSRWEFNDRSFFYVFGVFIMNPDGALQNEYFGNQITWPNAFPNAREIPNSNGKFLSIITEVLAPVYQGDLVIVNPMKGRNTLDAIRLIAPVRDISAATNKNFQDPYPLDENWFLISYAVSGGGISGKFRLFLMDVEGNRELLAWDTNQSIGQPIPFYERKAPAIVCQTDYSKATAELKVSNVYYGNGTSTAGITAGSIKKMRVIALEYRMYPSLGGNAAMYQCTPIACLGGSYESKRILGEMKVESDGSAAFIVPARTPFYVQLIDSSGCMIQSMRSWMTLQPGEKFDCSGCHEDKNVSPPPVHSPIANTPKALEAFYDITDSCFHYSAIIQPIFNAKCVSCHVAGHSSGLDLSGEKKLTSERLWCKSYNNLTNSIKKLVNYISANSSAEGLEPNTAGSSKSALITKLRARSGGMTDVSLTEAEMAKLCAWIDLSVPHGGKYSDDMAPEDSQFYEQRLLIRKHEEEFEAQNIAEFVKNGGYNNIEYGGTISGSLDQGKGPLFPGTKRVRDFQVAFSRLSRQLVMKLPSAGDVTLIDLKGRTVVRINVSNEDYLMCGGTARHVPSAGVPAGLYIAKFRGKSGAAERVIPVM